MQSRDAWFQTGRTADSGLLCNCMWHCTQTSTTLGTFTFRKFIAPCHLFQIALIASLHCRYNRTFCISPSCQNVYLLHLPALQGPWQNVAFCQAEYEWITPFHHANRDRLCHVTDHILHLITKLFCSLLHPWYLLAIRTASPRDCITGTTPCGLIGACWSPVLLISKIKIQANQ